MDGEVGEIKWGVDHRNIERQEVVRASGTDSIIAEMVKYIGFHCWLNALHK